MSGKLRETRSYVLRLWQAERAEQLVWRAALEDVRSGERWGFASLPELFAFLEERTCGAREGGGQPEGGGEG